MKIVIAYEGRSYKQIRCLVTVFIFLPLSYTLLHEIYVVILFSIASSCLKLTAKLSACPGFALGLKVWVKMPRVA